MTKKIASEKAKDISVLVVDDHFPTRDLIKAILRSVGFQKITQADGGRIGMERVVENRPQLIICDWNMPDGTGIELLSAIRNMPDVSSVPFLMLTAEVYKENVQEAIGLGVTDYIAKPFTAEILLNKVRIALQDRL